MPKRTVLEHAPFQWWAGIALIVLASLPFNSSGQADTSATLPAIEEQKGNDEPFRLKPSFGIGPGMFAFYGDVGRDHKAYSPLVTRVGFELRASTPITQWLEVGIYALHGRLGVNERSLERNLNFESRITTGGVRFQYNFLQLLRKDHVVEPFINIGFESVEFLTKTDLFDNQGRAYNYWSDGTIRDLAENDPNASNAVQVQRDYTYESDVRESNLDGFGKYLERTWAIPVGVGARMDLGNNLDFRIGTTMHFTLTDFVDGVSDNSVENRKGTAGNDRFLYSSFSIGYTIPMKRKEKKSKSTPLNNAELDQLAWNGDEDNDGVQDVHDKCPGTPVGVKVDASGCPLDGDQDGVPDFEDDEPDTAMGAPVDEHGVTIPDDVLLKSYLAYRDSGNVNIVNSRVESFGQMKPKVETKRVYVVKVGSQVEGITEDLIQKILSLPDVRTVEQGDSTYYVVGSYDAIPEALRRELELRGIGLEPVVMAEENGQLLDVSEEAEAARKKLIPPTSAPEIDSEAIIRVQLGAFRYPLSRDIFSEIKDLVVIKGDDGLTRYYTGSFKQVNPAAAHKVQMLLKGFNGAFLVAFKDGKRIGMKEAGAKLTGPENLNEKPVGTVDRSKIRFRIQVGSFAGNVPMEDMDKMIEMGDIKPIVGKDATRYFYGQFLDRKTAEEAKQAIARDGFTDAFVVGEYNGYIIPADEAQELMK